jgi:carboxyl-terminal processing protease
VTIALSPLAPGEEPKIELVGLGVKIGADGDAIKVEQVFPNSGAVDCGIAEGDHIVTVDGAAAAELGVDGAVARIRGPEGTTIALGLQKADKPVVVVTCTRKKLRA